MKLNSTTVVAWAAFTALALGVTPLASHSILLGVPAAQAQNLGQRVVTGSVVDGDSRPISGATVFLKNIKSRVIRSYTSTADGRFHFAQVNMAEDYDLWAEKSGKKSGTKTVSSWDARKRFEVELKIK